MKPSNPLYYKSADILAAFSRDCDPDSPAANGSETRVMFDARSLLAAGARRLALVDRRVRSGLGVLRRSSAMRRASQHRAPAGPDPQMSGDRAETRFAEPYRPRLTSHYALVASAE